MSEKKKSQNNPINKIAIIGASSGGPKAIRYIISRLDKFVTDTIIIAQHMDNKFIEEFSKGLNKIAKFPVKLVNNNAPITPGVCLIAPCDHSIELVDNNNNHYPLVKYTDQYSYFGVYPSIDHIMHSAAELLKERTIGLILTGMGHDGHDGLMRIKARDGITISQDEQSAISKRMPAGAIKKVKPDFILSLQQISVKLSTLLN